MAQSSSSSRVHRGFLDGPRAGLPVKPIANGHGSSVAQTINFAQSEKSLDTLSPRFALTITVRWPPCVALDGDLANSKAREVQQTGLPIHPKNIYGLKTGAILCFWENAKDHHATNIQKFLSKETTPEKMRDVNVLSITFHDGCRVRVTSEAFQSSILNRGNAKTFRFKKTAEIDDPLLPGPYAASDTILASRISNGTEMLDSPQLSSNVEEVWSPSNDAQQSSFATVHPPRTFTQLRAILPSSSAQPSPPSKVSDVATVQKEHDNLSLDGGSRLYQSSLDPKRPSRLSSYGSPISLSRNSSVSKSFPLASSSSVLQKRPAAFSEIEEHNTSTKKAKGEAFQPLSRSSVLGHSSSFHAPAIHQTPDVADNRLLVTLNSSRAVAATLREEQESRRREKRRMEEAYDKLKLENERISCAEQTALRRKDELKDDICELVETLRRTQKDYEESKHRMSEMHELLDDAESSKQVLRKKLQAAEEDRRISEKREDELRAALHEALHNQEKDCAHCRDVEQTALEVRSLAEDAQQNAEEGQKVAEEKQRIAEDALASERLRRIAAEETFLDMKTVFSGVNFFPLPDSNVQADGGGG